MDAKAVETELSDGSKVWNVEVPDLDDRRLIMACENKEHANALAILINNCCWITLEK